MKEIFKKEYIVPARWLIVIILILLVLGTFGYAYVYEKEKHQLYLSILTGLATGGVIALIQFVMSWREAKIVDQYESMGIVQILPTRDDRNAYGKIIQNTSERLWIMGYTASRLLRDFADVGKTANPYGKALVEILDRNVEVKILIANKKRLKNQNDKRDFDTARERLVDLKNRYPKNFHFRYYSHTPNHSIFIFDYECFLGSMFENLSSKETPVIRMKTNNEFAMKYIDTFNYEWNNAKEQISN